MPHKVLSVDAGSPAYAAGLRPGMEVLSVSFRKIEDILDWRYRTASRRFVLHVADSGKKRLLLVKNPDFLPLVVDFEQPLLCRESACTNHCVFCFIDQLPRGMRKTLYFKDDDFRLSFLKGNYITLTNLSKRELDRICRLRISPINISVHATNPAVRALMLGNKGAGDILRLISKLASARIAMNCQIVVCPGINDGDVLEKTLDDLAGFYPQVASVSVVPVGLTAHRQRLYPLKPVGKKEAQEIIGIVARAAGKNFAQSGDYLFYAADELYIRAGEPIPPAESYGGYPQLENGVGMLRLLFAEFEEALKSYGGEKAASPFTVATGAAAAPFIGGLIDKLAAKCDNLNGSVLAVENRFFGGGVDVSGLVVGRDLIDALKASPHARRVLIPENMLRHDGEVFLDDITPAEVERETGCTLTVVKNNGGALLSAMLGKE